jgi:phosphatidylinositol phospholipase C, beta
LQLFFSVLITKLEPGKPLAPPNLLLKKILIKNKRMKPEVEKVEMELFLKGELKTDDDPKEDAGAAPAADAPAAAPAGDGAAPAAGGDAAAAHTGSTTNVHPWLSSMVNYAQPVHFNGFEAAASKSNL